jgi:hypothetical protein
VGVTTNSERRDLLTMPINVEQFAMMLGAASSSSIGDKFLES